MIPDPVAAGLNDLGISAAFASNHWLADRTREVLLGVERLRLLELYLNRRGEFRSQVRFLLGRPTISTRNTLSNLARSAGVQVRFSAPLSELVVGKPAERVGVLHAPTCVAVSESRDTLLVRGFDVARRIRSIVDEFSPFPLLVGVHGSFADSSYVEGLSDLDILVIIPRGTLARPMQRLMLSRAIGRLNMIAVEVDPFQHHGTFCIPEELLRCYPESYLPLSILQSVRWLSGSQTRLDVAAIRSPLASAFFAHRLLKYLDWHSERMETLTYFAVREVLQVVQLLPCLLADVVGGPVRKEEAIPWLLKRNDADLDILRICTEQRFSWSTLISGLSDLTKEQTELRKRVLAGYGGDRGISLLLRKYGSFIRALVVKGVLGVIH